MILNFYYLLWFDHIFVNFMVRSTLYLAVGSVGVPVRHLPAKSPFRSTLGFCLCSIVTVHFFGREVDVGSIPARGFCHHSSNG